MSPFPAPGRTGLPVLRRLLAGTVLVAGAGALVLPGPVDAARPVAAAGAPAAATASAAPAAARVVEPWRVRIPAIGVDSHLERLGLDTDGALLPPADFSSAGWFSGAPAPGEVGPAVLAGHVDSTAGPAVFFSLGDLVPGSAVLVDRDDGTTVRFEVTRVDRYPKDHFPTAAVYGPVTRPELRLITCGGDFDSDRRSYPDNVVVTAVAGG